MSHRGMCDKASSCWPAYMSEGPAAPNPLPFWLPLRRYHQFRLGCY